MYLARALVLRDDDRPRLEALTRGHASSATLAVRARTVLLASEGLPNIEIGRITGLSRPSILKWRSRYMEQGVGGLRDAPRPGRVAVIDELAVITETLADSGKPPAELGISHWSVRLMADRLGISFSSVGRIWRKWSGPGPTGRVGTDASHSIAWTLALSSASLQASGRADMVKFQRRRGCGKRGCQSG